MLQRYINHGLIDTKGGVRLKMSGLQEGLSFANQRSAWETWELLEKLDERITLRWVVPEQPCVFQCLPFFLPRFGGARY